MYVCNWSDLTVKTLELIGKIASCLPLRLKATVFPSAGGVTRGWGEALSVTVQRGRRRGWSCVETSGGTVSLPEAFADLRCASDQCRAPGAGAQVSGR